MLGGVRGGQTDLGPEPKPGLQDSQGGLVEVLPPSPKESGLPDARWVAAPTAVPLQPLPEPLFARVTLTGTPLCCG